MNRASDQLQRSWQPGVPNWREAEEGRFITPSSTARIFSAAAVFPSSIAISIQAWPTA
ncbi:unknown [Akkermansia sp. CAG:344]|nr:unknown [Akkermansia sp. CAG:344]